MSIRGVSFFFEVAGNFSQVSKYHQCHKLFCTGFKKKKREATVAVAAVSTLKKKAACNKFTLRERCKTKRSREEEKRLFFRGKNCSATDILQSSNNGKLHVRLK